MEYQKTQEDKTREIFDMNNDPVLIFLKNQGDHQFKPGDILVRLYFIGDKWETEKVSSTTDTPKKYLYAFENELGIGYLKQYKTNGKLSETATCITQFDLGRCKFALDPEYADHIILCGDEEFKPTNSFKEKKKFRDRAINNNKKLIIGKDRVSIEAWIDQLKVGDTFYQGGYVPDMVVQQYEVLAVEDIPVSSYDSYYADRLIRNHGYTKRENVKSIKAKVIKHRWQQVGSIQKFNVPELIGSSITQKEPFPLSESDR
jgi:hypothetical protein